MAKQPRSLTGKVAVVTGGGRGIGKALSHALAREGVRVAIADLDVVAAQQAAAEVGAGALALGLDVTDRSAFTAALDEVEQRLGPLDIVVNNAGIMPIGPFEHETDATVIRQLELNLHAVIHGSKEAVKRMKPRGTGHIVNVASIAGKAPAPGGATYAACKHGVVGLSESLRAELHGTGVQVSVVMPAFVNTELASGTKELLGIKRSAPEDVADAVIDALKTGRFEVWVPRSLKSLVIFSVLVPRSLAEWVGRKISGNGPLLQADRQARAAYEARAAHSTPAVEAVVAEVAAEGDPIPEQPAAA
jgi:NAD(P)-dependent dehydrogenase (short-subunit alcohol dehydrogenase family)